MNSQFIIKYFYMQTKGNKKSKPDVILIYYNFKGVAQSIRLLLFYLQIPFTDIFLDQYQTQKASLQPQVKQLLEEHPINRSELPAIIHQGQIVYQINQIMTYICRSFDREDLLGVTIQQKSRVCQFLQMYSNKVLGNLRFLIGYLSDVLSPQLQDLSLLSFIQAKYDEYMQTSGYVMQLTIHYLNNGGPFIFGTITILDFYFVQASRQVLASFGSIDCEIANSKWTETAKKYLALKQTMGQQIRKVNIMRGMKKFHDSFISQQFYLKNEEYIQRFKLVPKRTIESTINATKKIWAIEQKYMNIE